ncbi:MAG: protease inhibitor I42 family protein [Clostridia bacterium]|nr:protease inhibitor I42 family protein [Clostridia bacterium]
MKQFIAMLAALVLGANLSLAAVQTGEKTVATENTATAEIVLDANPTTGYSWTAFVIAGDSVVLENDEGVYAADATEAPVSGAGGKTTFTLKAVMPGESLVQFTYLRPWEGEAAETKIVLATVGEDLSVHTMDVTEGGVYEATVTGTADIENALLLNTETHGDIIAVFPAEMALPNEGSKVIIYTNGVMTMSLPGIVNVLAWEFAPNPLARG